ncbi:DNA methyltransferase [Paramecium bursaria Chlorella virus NY2A]|uniref:site-specific DNA-methyltransferase (adenine-specific) n=1 Tax=Paramecium bursaria Chlorella virus NY2A TaxID=46021 RepID=A7IXU9_PBCVN|nr:DNA methyltransferase [Paramecium bursaria Chlorella virus NY2A]ABT15173.1 hypothetical protein NY2A_B774R [Paramecium bursaria Chlorella virus NY2A]
MPCTMQRPSSSSQLCISERRSRTSMLRAISISLLFLLGILFWNMSQDPSEPLFRPYTYQFYFISTKSSFYFVNNDQFTVVAMSSPFLKWVGGKQKLIDDIIKHFPNNIDTYYEPFLGGGSVLLAVLNSDIRIKKIRANDLNAYLVQTYIDIRDNTEELISSLKELKNIDDYYENRKLFNELKKENQFSVKASALFIYLNKTCFRGLYREGPNGFNVPFGHYKNPNWINADLLRVWSDKIKNVEFSCLPYQDFLNDVGEHDFVYLDPPYAPENKTSFTKYNVSDFLDHEQFFSVVKKLPRFVMSNSKTEHTLYAFAEFEIHEIVARRSINSKKPGSTTTEIVVIKV